MPILSHKFHYDIFNYAIQKTVRRGQKVEITDDQAERIENAGLGVWDVARAPVRKRTPRNAGASATSGSKTERRSK